MVKTRKDVLLEKYNEFQNFCKINFPNKQVLPLLSVNMDLADLCFVISYNFSPHYQKHDKYIETITYLSASYGIKFEEGELEAKQNEIGALLDDIILFLKSQ